MCRGVNLTGLRPGIFVSVLLCCAGLFVLVFVPQSFYDQTL